MVVLGSVGEVMSSQGIRAYELGRALKLAGADVRLFATEVNGAADLEIPSLPFDRRQGLGAALQECDVVVAQPQWPTMMRELRRSGKRLIFDLFYPDLLEKLEHPDGSGVSRGLRLALTRDRFNEALRLGHHLICASQKQVDLWLGAMMGLGLIDPVAYERDPSMRSVIDAVPYGLPEEPPAPGPPPWDRFEGIGDGDEILVWNGGIWPWFDAPNAVRAIAELAKRRPRIRLVFMAVSTEDLSREADAEARALASELGVLDRNVFFNDSWVPYGERGPWMTTADCALICHRAGLEARFCFRSRVLDCYWARLPVVSVSGDLFSDEIEREDLGATAPPGDPVALAAAIEKVLQRGRASYEADFERVAGRYRWSQAALPLVRFVFADGDPPRLGEGKRQPMASALRGASYRVLEIASRGRDVISGQRGR
jgi:glycosyltransferase involved in cell wall biosynthesis